MITNFELFNEQLNIPDNLTYDEAVDIIKYENVIKDYFMERYPEMVTNTERPILNLRRKFTRTSVEKIIRFAKKQNDEKLTILIYDYLDFIDNIKMKRDVKKYNL